MTTPNELPGVRCYTCGKVISSKYNVYKELSNIGYSNFQIFEVLNIKRYCCRIRLTNLSVIAASYDIEPDSLASASIDAVSSGTELSPIAQKAIADPSIKYLQEILKINRTPAPIPSVIKTRVDMDREVRKKEIDKDMVKLDYKFVDKRLERPEIKPTTRRSAGSGMFAVKKKVGSGKAVSELNQIKPVMVDVGAGYKVKKLTRTIYLTDYNKRKFIEPDNST